MAAADGNKSDVPLTKSVTKSKDKEHDIGNVAIVSSKSKERTITLKNVDTTDTTPPSSWPDEIPGRKDIRRMDKNGEWIECALCFGTGQTYGIISMKPKFNVYNWSGPGGHLSTQGNLNHVAAREGEKRENKKRGKKNKTQTGSSMTTFYQVQKKKKPEVKPPNSTADIIDVDAAGVLDSA